VRRCALQRRRQLAPPPPVRVLRMGRCTLEEVVVVGRIVFRVSHRSFPCSTRATPRRRTACVSSLSADVGDPPFSLADFFFLHIFSADIFFRHFPGTTRLCWLETLEGTLRRASMEGGGNQNEACAGLFAHADSVCGTATATTTNDALAPACREATARALHCLRYAHARTLGRYHHCPLPSTRPPL
jgi:hypothetical protein